MAAISFMATNALLHQTPSGFIHAKNWRSKALNLRDKPGTLLIIMAGAVAVIEAAFPWRQYLTC
jgi:hypothetical protein